MITGGCGFIGSNFIRFLLDESNFKIVNYDSLASGDKSNVESSDKYTLVIGDLCDNNLLDNTLHRHSVQQIIHFAALTHVSNSFESPQEYVRANIQGTLSLLEAVKKYGRITRFIYISTDEVYGDNTLHNIPKAENSQLEPTNPYSATKLSAEKFVDVYRVSYQIPACGVRMCNVYGPRQTRDKMVPKFIGLAMDGKPFTIEGDGHQLRCWLFVADVCRAIYSVLLKGKVGEIYNIGSTTELSVLDMAMKIKNEIESALGMINCS